MRGRRPRTDLGFRPAETRILGRAGASGPILLYVLIAAVIVALGLVSTVRPERAGSGGGSVEAVLMTMGDEGRSADWETFFARHPLPDDAIRARIVAANEATPGDVVCVPLDGEASDSTCR